MADATELFKSINKITFEQMANFITEEHPEDLAWFKEVAYQKADGTPSVNKKGQPKYNHLNATRKFCEKYGIVEPKKKPNPSKTNTFFANIKG